MKFIFKMCAVLAGIVGVDAAAACASRPAAPAPVSPRDGGDAHRLVALLDYVAGDYPRAVHDGVVVSPVEYEEQVHFVGEARAMAAGLAPTAAAPADTLLALVGDVETRVRARDAAPEVARA